MKLPRQITVKINHILDQCIPPIIRDSRWFMPFIYSIVLKKCAKTLKTFKKSAPFMNNEDFKKTYKTVDPVLYGLVERPMDLNQACFDKILEEVRGETVLDVGCGKGQLTKALSQRFSATGYDMVVTNELISDQPNIQWVTGPAEKLPFPDKAFDTVVCAHTLEHVPFFMKTVQELRRVTKKRLIIITPAQRPYHYTFDLHVHFFPYPYSLLMALNEPDIKHTCKKIDGDLFYIQEIDESNQIESSI